jgi:hypothetical protein
VSVWPASGSRSSARSPPHQHQHCAQVRLVVPMCGCVRVLCVWVFVGECLAGRRQSLQCEESPSPAPALRTGETGCAYVWVCACVVCVRVCVCVCACLCLCVWVKTSYSSLRVTDEERPNVACMSAHTHTHTYIHTHTHTYTQALKVLVRSCPQPPPESCGPQWTQIWTIKSKCADLWRLLQLVRLQTWATFVLRGLLRVRAGHIWIVRVCVDMWVCGCVLGQLYKPVAGAAASECAK